MRTKSNIRPENAFEINSLADGVSEVALYENIKKEQEDIYSYDLYILTVPSRETLSADVEANMAQWLKKAKETEGTFLPNHTAEERIALLEDAVDMLIINSLEV